MGQSSSADIHFGYSVTNEYGEAGNIWIGYEPDEESDEESFLDVKDWLDYINDDTVSSLYAEEPEYPKAYGEWTAARDKWQAENPDWVRRYNEQRERSKERAENSPVEVDRVGYMGYSIPVIYIKGYHQHVYDGEAKIIEPLETPSEETIEAAKIFCEKNRIVWKEPTWLLSSSFG